MLSFFECSGCSGVSLRTLIAWVGSTRNLIFQKIQLEKYSRIYGTMWLHFVALSHNLKLKRSSISYTCWTYLSGSVFWMVLCCVFFSFFESFVNFRCRADLGLWRCFDIINAEFFRKSHHSFLTPIYRAFWLVDTWVTTQILWDD